MNKKNVLLIDDDDLFLYLTERTIQKANFLGTINSISDVHEALAYLDACAAKEFPFPDIIFVDMNMPDMNGMDFADLFNKKYAPLFPETKLVMLTSSISRKEKVKALDLPSVRDFLEKPLTEKKLKSVLE